MIHFIKKYGIKLGTYGVIATLSVGQVSADMVSKADSTVTPIKVLGLSKLEHIKASNTELQKSIAIILQQAQQYVDAVSGQKSIARMTDAERKVHINVLRELRKQLTSLHTPSASLEEGHVCGADTPVMQAMAEIYSLMHIFRNTEKVSTRVNSTDLDTHIWSLYGAGASASALDNSLDIYNNAPGITDGICATSDETLLTPNVLPSFINSTSVGNILAIIGDFLDYMLDLDANGNLPVADMYILSLPNSLAQTSGTSAASTGVRCGDINVAVMVGASGFPAIGALWAHEVLYHGVSSRAVHTTTTFDIGNASVGGTSTPVDPATISDYNTKLNNSSCIASCYSLPIELVSFDADYDDDTKSVQLDWTLATQVNTDRMVIEHSLDGSSWSEIPSCDIKGAGTVSEEKSYSCVHPSPVSGVINYYRIVDYDYDGRKNLGPMQSVSIPLGKDMSYTGSNPVQVGQPLHISGVTSMQSVEILSMNGSIVRSYTNVTSDMKAPDKVGMFIIRLVDANGSAMSYKIVVTE